MCAKSQQSGDAATHLGPTPTQHIATTQIEIAHIAITYIEIAHIATTYIGIAHIVRSYDGVACPGCGVSIR
ncbi:hypothetical protein [Xanthomonas sp. NCPPB 2632]|uniref:hypothetical protein n=1 Tax=Xanthomonas sp. NCPPB 2632 TaxID=3240912 RepID=UPI003516CAA7